MKPKAGILIGFLGVIAAVILSVPLLEIPSSWEDELVMFLTAAIAGFVIALVGIPMWMRRVPPNWGYGLRVDATLRDEVVWYEANARSGRDLFVAGIAMALVGFLVFVARVPMNLAAWIDTGFMLLAVIGVALNGWLFANRLASERDEASTRSN